MQITRAFAFRDFRFLWISSLTASFAMQMQIVARGWLTYEMTDSAIALSMVMLSFMAPSVVFSLLGGVLADRMRKKPIMLISQALNTVLTGALAWIIFTDQVTFMHFIYFGLFNGTVLSLSMPARSTIIPEIVGRKVVVNAMALSSATFNLSRIMGPAIAGLLIGFLAAGDTASRQGVGIVFFVITGLYFLSVIGTALLRYEGKPVANADAQPVLSDITEGLRYILHDRLIMGILLMGLIPMTFGFAASFLLPVFNSEVIRGGPEQLGFLVTATGLGALAGSLTLAQIGDTRAKGRILVYSGYCWAIALIFFSMSTNFYLAMFFSLFTGLFGSVMGSMNMSMLQLVVPQYIRGRIMAINWMIHGLMPIGMVPIALIAEWWTIQHAIFISAIMVLVSVWLIRYFYSEVRKVGRTDDEEFIKNLQSTIKPKYSRQTELRN